MKNSYFALLALAWSVAAPAVLADGLETECIIINEFLAENQNGLLDGDGNTSDWIELYNAGDEAVDLTGWRLTDDVTDLGKWNLPAQSLAAGAYLLVFASGSPVDNYVDPSGHPHANFKLNAVGEYLALVRPDGTVSQHFSPQYPEQKPDISFGRAVGSVEVLVAPDDPAKMFVPSDGALGLTWTGASEHEPLADSPADGWTIVTASIGFDTTGSSVDVIYSEDFELINLGDPDVNNGGAAGIFTGTTWPNTDFALSGGTNLLKPAEGSAWLSSMPAELDTTFAVLHSGTTATVDLIDTFAANTTYALCFTQFRRDDLAGDEITAKILTTGGTELASETFAAVTTTDIYAPRILVLNTADNNAGNGQAIRLQLIDSSGGSSIPQVAIDNVQLVAALSSEGGIEKIFDESVSDLVETDVEAQVAGIASSAYLRIPFEIPEPIEFNTLLLNMQYDDGFVAYLNGTEVARDNVPDPVAFDSLAPLDRPLPEVFTVRQFDLGDRTDLLRTGTNILAIHAVNDAVDGTDFLMRAELIGAEVVPGRYLSEPTPGALNTLGFLDFVADTTFSGDPAEFHGRGFYDASFEVLLATTTPGATIAYTTDGSEPSPDHGTQVLAPDPASPPSATVQVSTTTPLRVMAYADDHLPTNIDTQTYLFTSQIAGQTEMDPEVVGSTLPGYSVEEALLAIPTISITTAHENLFGPNGIYTNSTAEGPQWERGASMEWIRPDGGEEFQIDAGLYMHGASSAVDSMTPKHGFRFYFRSEYGAGKLDFPLFDGNPVERFDQLVIKALSTDTWPVAEWAPTHEGFRRWERERAAYIRDQWIRDAQIAIADESCDGRFAHVYLNGVYWGLYNVMERPIHSFQSEHYGGEKEEYDVLHDYPQNGAVQNGSLTKWNEMMSLAGAGLNTEAAYQKIQGRNPDGTPNPSFPNYLNVDSLIDYFILHISSGADDWPYHNWWAARRLGPESEGFRFFSWDQEISNNSLDRTLTSAGVPFESVSNGNTPAFLYDKLRHNPVFQVRFGDRVHELLFNGGLLSPEGNRARWNVRSAEIDQAIVGESARWGDVQRAEPYRREVEWLANEAWQDTYWDLNHPKAVQRFRNVDLYPDLDPPEFNQYGGYIPPGFGLTFSASATVYYTTDGSDPRLPSGAINPTATSGPGTTVNTTTEISARAFDGVEWSALNQVTFVVDVAPDASNIVVSEIMYNPDGPDDTEFIELLNISTEPVAIAGMRFDGAIEGIEFTFDAAEPALGPGERIVVVRSQSAFAANYVTAGMRIAIGEYDASGTKLSNDGEQVTLRDSLGGLIQQFTYNDIWYSGSDGGGFSLVIKDPTGSAVNWNVSGGWHMSYQPGGSPGEDDLLLEFPGRIESVAMDGDGKVLLGFRGDAGRPYVLQASTDLTGWVEIGSFTAVDGITTLNDADATLYSRRFYRIGLLP